MGLWLRNGNILHELVKQSDAEIVTYDDNSCTTLKVNMLRLNPHFILRSPFTFRNVLV